MEKYYLSKPIDADEFYATVEKWEKTNRWVLVWLNGYQSIKIRKYAMSHHDKKL